MGTRNLPPKEWIFNLQNKLIDEIQEVGLESDSIVETCIEQPSFSGLKGELETAVSQYLNSVKELGIYKQSSPRDTPCQFTTFKTPALPKKTINTTKSPSSTDALLDVKFQVTPEETSVDSGTYENFVPDSRGLDNPLYLSLSECSSGSSNKSGEELSQNSPSPEHSDEDHIYENVEQHVYDTVSCPPRPKLPPKPNRLNKVPEPKFPKKASYLLQSKQEVSGQGKANHSSLPGKTEDSQTTQKSTPLILERSETSDLGSSGSEDTTSEEDWPLPPFPLESPEEPLEDIPLPPPPPEIALQKLEEEVNEADEKNKTINKNKAKNKSEVDKQTLEDNRQICLNNNSKESPESLKAELETKIETIKAKRLSEADKQISTEEEIYLFRTESFDKKHLRRKLSTLKKGLNAYKKAAKVKDEQLRQPNLVVQDDGSENSKVESPAVRHSVIIELKDTSYSAPTSLQLSETQIRERLESFDTKPNITHEIKDNGGGGYSESEDGGILVNIKQKSKNDKAKSNLKSGPGNFNEHVIEIAEDGSWEMKNVKGCSESTMESETSNSQEIDPFTGLTLVASISEPNPVSLLKETPKTYEEPEAYFEDKVKKEDTNNLKEMVLKDDEKYLGCTDPISVTGNTDSSALAPSLPTDSTPVTVTESILVSSENSEEDTHTTSSAVLPTSCIIDQNMDDLDADKNKLSHVGDDSKLQPHPVNLGAAIMEGYERDLRRVKENLNLPEVSLLEFGDTVKDLEMQRKNVIEQMTVKAKKKDSWIRTFRTGSVGNTSKENGNDVKDALVFSNTKKLFENKADHKDSTTKTVHMTFENKSLMKTMTEEPVNMKSKSEPSVESNLSRLEKSKDSSEDQIISENDKKDDIIKNKNEINKSKNNTGVFLGKCLYNKVEKPHHTDITEQEANTKITETKQEEEPRIVKGEVDSESILSQKEATKSYWKNKMLAAADDGGWEPVANVKFRAENQPNNNEGETPESTVPPPPEFSADTPNSLESLTSHEDVIEEEQPSPAPIEVKNERPARQYVYGADETNKNKTCLTLKTLNPTPIKDSEHENIIEAEIREQQLREEELRRENDLRNREKTGGASSPSSHASDEGFVDPPIEDPPSPPLTSTSPVSEGFTHTLKGPEGEAIIYDAVIPPSEYFTDKTLNSTGGSSETKIALEIRELKEREAELKALRELREREQQLRSMRDEIPEPRTYPTEGEEDNVEAERINTTTTSRDILEEHLTSLTTTTDEGNFSECGDPASSEDKSSDGSNSRIMSPDLHSFGSHAENRPRKVTVKPFEDDENDSQPVYTQMKKESVIEREIRLAKEREEAFRREKGLPTHTPSAPTPKVINKAPIDPPSPNQSVDPVVVSNSTVVLTNGVAGDKTIKNGVEPPKRGVQHRLATNRIQQEIKETSQRERELRKAGKIRTLSEDTVDSKVTRLSDFAADQESSSTPRASSVSSVSSFSSLNSSPSRVAPNNVHSPLITRTSSPLSPSSSYNSPTLTPSPTSSPATSTRLIRSFSTTNLSTGGYPGGMRAPQKGLMQKFIASRGKITKSTFAPPSPTGTLTGVKTHSSTANGIPTRPMRVSPKVAPVIRRDPETKTNSEEETQPSKLYKRTHATAEEKIQEELREMKKREEELRRLRAKNLARSQPNLAGLEDDAYDEDLLSSPCDGVDSTSFLPEVNGLRTALSNPNLLDEEAGPPTTQVPQVERGMRRRSALVAQWEGRIQQTA